MVKVEKNVQTKTKSKTTDRGEFILPPFKGKTYFTAIKSESIMIVPFSKHFEFGKMYETFKLSLSSKRVYNRSILEIADDNNRVLNHSFTETTIDIETGNKVKIPLNKKGSIADEFILNYLSLKMNIDDGGELTKIHYHIFIAELINLLTKNLMKIIKHYVDSIYHGSMDEAIDMEKHSFEMSTTFVDADIKQLCYVKYAGNLLIPLCTHYCNLMSRDVDSKEFFLDLYKTLFQKVSEGSDLDTMSKLHKYVTMIVNNAFKTHKQIYNRMTISGTTKDNEIEEVFSKILTTIITKLQPKDTIPAFIAEAIKNSSSKFKPREDDGYNVLQGFSDDFVHSGGDDNSVVTEAERMESRITRPDELLKLVRKYSPDDTINKISLRYGIFVDNYEEYKFYAEKMILHDYQTKIIFQTFSHIYGGYENMFDNNRHNYIRLLILTEKYLKNFGLNIIADYLCAINVGFSFQNRWSGKVSDRKLFEDPRYDKIIDSKYKFSKAQFEKRNFIRDDIVLLANNIYKYNSFNNLKNGTIINHTDEELIDAVLDYYLKCVL
jgi:hypothetical protein